MLMRLISEALTFLSYDTEGNEAVYTYYHDDGYEKITRIRPI